MPEPRIAPMGIATARAPDSSSAFSSDGGVGPGWGATSPGTAMERSGPVAPVTVRHCSASSR